MKKLRQQLLLGSGLGLLSLLWLTSQVIAGTARKEINQTFDLRQGGEISLKNTRGRIEITSWDNEQVKLRAVITVKHRNRRIADEYMEEVHLDINDGRDYLEIDVDYPHKRSSNGGISSLFS